MNAAMELIGLGLLTTLCVICVRNDMKAGIVPNRVLAAFLVCAVVYDVVCYGFFARDLATSFLLNVVLISLVSIVLFYTHSFAGGDCKMAIVLSLLYPASCYISAHGTNCTLIVSLLLSFLFGYAYLLMSSLYLIARKKKEIAAGYIRDSVLTFAKSYLAAISYISMIVSLTTMIGGFGSGAIIWATRVACVVVALCTGKYPRLRDWRCFLPAAGVSLAASVLSRTIPLSLKPGYVVLVFCLSLTNAVIKTTIYESVSVDELRKGMVLTMLSSMLMQTSRVRGLPGISTEDLRSRLSEEEVSSVREWARVTKTTSLVIVKKIPFAAMISMGYLSYAFLGEVLRYL